MFRRYVPGIQLVESWKPWNEGPAFIDIVMVCCLRACHWFALVAVYKLEVVGSVFGWGPRTFGP